MPNEQIGCLEEDSNGARVFARTLRYKRLGLFRGKSPFRDLHHDIRVGRVIVDGLPVTTPESANT
jgi:hypothetical protein